MNPDVGGIAAIIPTVAKYALALLVTCVVVLIVPIIVPPIWIERLGLREFLAWTKGGVFVMAVLAGVITMLDAASRLASWMNRRRLARSARHRREEYLRNLTHEEKMVLARFLAYETKTWNLSIQSGVVNGLVQAVIIYRAAAMGDLDEFDYNIQPWAWEILRATPSLLEPELSAVRAELARQRRSPRLHDEDPW